MYRRVVKIARVLEESENENWALNLGKGKCRFIEADLEVEIINSIGQVTHKGKENSLWLGKIDPSISYVGDTTMDHVSLRMCGAMGVEN